MRNPFSRYPLKAYMNICSKVRDGNLSAKNRGTIRDRDLLLPESIIRLSVLGTGLVSLLNPHKAPRVLGILNDQATTSAPISQALNELINEAATMHTEHYLKMRAFAVNFLTLSAAL